MKKLYNTAYIMHEVHFQKKINQQLNLDGYGQNVSRKLLWQVCWQQRKQN